MAFSREWFCYEIELSCPISQVMTQKKVLHLDDKHSHEQNKFIFFRNPQACCVVSYSSNHQTEKKIAHEMRGTLASQRWISISGDLCRGNWEYGS